MKNIDVQADEFTEDGIRLFNPTKPHGTVYVDGFSEISWVQNNVNYRADRRPVGYSPSPDKAEKVHWKTAKKLAEAQNASASGET